MCVGHTGFQVLDCIKQTARLAVWKIVSHRFDWKNATWPQLTCTSIHLYQLRRNDFQLLSCLTVLACSCFEVWCWRVAARWRALPSITRVGGRQKTRQCAKLFVINQTAKQELMLWRRSPWQLHREVNVGATGKRPKPNRVTINNPVVIYSSTVLMLYFLELRSILKFIIYNSYWRTRISGFNCKTSR